MTESKDVLGHATLEEIDDGVIIHYHFDTDKGKEFLKHISSLSTSTLSDDDYDEPCDYAIDHHALRARFDHLDEVYEGMSEEEKHEAYIYGQIIRAIDDAPPVTLKLLDKIRAEIEQEYTKFRNKSDRWSERACGLGTALEIIDKYRKGVNE